MATQREEQICLHPGRFPQEIHACQQI